jgi:pimeloyl-ACP methyl ester carboxylesterase
VSSRDRPTALTWTEAGDPNGPVVVYFHGTAKTHEAMPFPEAAARLHLRVLMADRPGYGGSPARTRASFKEIAEIMLRDLDAMGVEQFAVVGFSGGGPHALAFTNFAPARTRAVGLIGSWAPMNPPDRGLPAGVRFAMRVAAALPRAVLHFILFLGRQSSAGMVDDVRRVARPWGFTVERIASTARVVVWHAEDDPQVPIAPWRDITGITLNVVPGAEHEPSADTWEAALGALR